MEKIYATTGLLVGGRFNVRAEGGYSEECWQVAVLKRATEPELGKWVKETELSRLYGHHDRGEETEERRDGVS